MNSIKLSTKVSSVDRMFSTKEAIENISVAMNKLGVYLSSVHQSYDYDAMVLSISYALDDFSNAIINLGCDNKYVIAYKEWAGFGWSFNANIDKKFFLTAPNSLKEADSIMHEYCNAETITKMIEQLKSADVSKKDLEEAYFNYINRQYKSSTMLLFSLLDKQLIKRKIFKKDGYLKTGAGVVGELNKSDEQHKEGTHLHYLQFVLIINCLMKLFESNKNFENEPTVINRNFLMHGMSDKEVNETDCLKVWSALYSFVVIYPELEKELLLNET